MRRFCLILIGMMLLSAVGVAQQAADPYREMLQYKQGGPRTALAAVEAEIRGAKPEQLASIEARLDAGLQSPEATDEYKDWACRQLRQIGSERSLPALLPLLGHERLSTVARWALQSIRGPRVDEALRGELGKLEGNLKAGVIQTLGARGDRKAVPLLVPLAGDANPAVAEAALYALGHIGGPEALAALEQAKPAPGLERYRKHALLLCVEQVCREDPAKAAATYQAIYDRCDDVTLKIAALRGVIVAGKGKSAAVVSAALKSDCPRLRLAAAKFVCELGGSDLTPAALGELAALPADVQATLLGLVKDKAALPAVIAATQSKDPLIRAAAIETVGRLGDRSSVAMLLRMAASEQGDAQSAARRALEALRGAEIDAELVAVLERPADPMQGEAVRVLAARGSAAAVPVLLKFAAEGAPLQNEALAALGVVAEAPALPAMVQFLVDAHDARRRAAVEAAVVAICRRTDKDAAAGALLAALPGKSGEVRAALVRLLVRVPTPKTLEALRSAAADADPAVKDAAIRGLADWPDLAVAADLVALARTPPSPVYKVLALRAIARLGGLADQPVARRVNLLAEAMPLAGRADERRILLAALAETADPRALDLAIRSLGDAEVEIEAATAVVKLAKAVRKTNLDAAAAAIQKVHDVCKTPAARQLAESPQIALDGMTNIASLGTASSPDDLDKDGTAGDDQAAIDGNAGTYWDEQDGQKLYRLVVAFKQPEKIGAVSILGYEQHQFSPKDFEIVCDGKVVKRVENAQYDEAFLVVRLPPTQCSTVELRITGYYGGSPAVRELGIYRIK